MPQRTVGNCGSQNRPAARELAASLGVLLVHDSELTDFEKVLFNTLRQPMGTTTISLKEQSNARVISAKIIDSTHLELSQPLDASPGEVIRISVPSESDDEMALWREAGKQHLLDAYADEDAVYDEL